MAILFLDFFGSDPSKMDQIRKFGEQTSRILEFKPEGLDFYYIYNPIPTRLCHMIYCCGDKKIPA